MATTMTANARRLDGSTVAWVVLGAAGISQLAWIDPLFLPLVVIGPLLVGAIAGAKRLSRTAVATMWFLSGIGMLVGDWVANHEDQVFHLALGFVMAGLAAFAHWVASAISDRRHRI
jgi:hypothetical protein